MTGRARGDTSLSCEPRLTGDEVGDGDGEFDAEEVTSCFALMRKVDEGSMAGFFMFSFDGDVHTMVSCGVYKRRELGKCRLSGEDRAIPTTSNAQKER